MHRCTLIAQYRHILFGYDKAQACVVAVEGGLVYQN